MTGKTPFRNIIGKDIPRLLTECAEIESPYSVVGSYGKGRWTGVPWIAVFDTRITNSAQKGVYIVYFKSPAVRPPDGRACTHRRAGIARAGLYEHEGRKPENANTGCDGGSCVSSGAIDFYI